MSEFRFLPMTKISGLYADFVASHVINLFVFAARVSLSEKILQHILLLSRVKQLQDLNQNAKVLGQKSLSDDLLSDQIL